jgi:hypothetical protein
MSRSEGGGVKVDGLRKRTPAARSEARVEAAPCFGAEIEDDRWRRWHDGF